MGVALIILLGAIWMFVLGIFVGRNSIPVRFAVKDIKEELASLKNEHEDKTKTENNITDFAKEEGLNFYEDLKKNKSVKNTKNERTSPAEGNSKKAVPGSGKNTIVKSATNKKESVIDKTEEGEKTFTIQVASLKDEKTSDRMVAKLKELGYPAYKTNVTIPELGVWFRVRVGHYSSKEEASSTIEGLKKRNLLPILIQE